MNSCVKDEVNREMQSAEARTSHFAKNTRSARVGFTAEWKRSYNNSLHCALSHYKGALSERTQNYAHLVSWIGVHVLLAHFSHC